MYGHSWVEQRLGTASGEERQADDSRGSEETVDETLWTFVSKLNTEVKWMTPLLLTFTLDPTRCDRSPSFAVFVARRHAAHDRRMTRDPSPRRDQSISARQRGAASRFASNHVRLGPVRRVPLVTPSYTASAVDLVSRNCATRWRYFIDKII